MSSELMPGLVVAALRRVVGAAPVALHEPHFGGNEWAYVKECLDTGWVSSVGKFVDRFERDLAAFTGAAHAVAVVNGTAALHVCLKLSGVVAGDEVLVPAMTFIATANAISYCGAVPHFADISESTLGVDAAALGAYLEDIAEVRGGVCINRRTGRTIRALLPMHAFGHPADVDGLLAVADRFCLALVEDAAESLGSYYHGRHTGTFGRLASLSFNGNKVVTTGGGGAILTNDPALAKHAKHLTTTAKVPHRWEFIHDEIGFNYRLPNINAALGCAQLEQLPRFLADKRRLFELYRDAFSGISGVRVFAEPENCRGNYWLQALVLEEAEEGQRDKILAAANDAGLMSRPVWTLMHHLPIYSGAPRMPLPVAESIARRLINIPSSPHLAKAAAA